MTPAFDVMARTGRPPKHPDDRADALLSIRVPRSVHEWIQELAAKNGKTITEWVLDCINVELERNL